MSVISRRKLDDSRTVVHWYDFLCPFCYIAQNRNAILRRHGIDVIELPFQAHPDIPPGGITAGIRKGPIYEMLEREAREAELPLHWPSHLPNTSLALAAAEWTRQHRSREFPQLHKELFEAHFALGEDLEDLAVIDRYANRAGIDLADLHTALADGTANKARMDAEAIGHKHGIQSTPAWLFPQGMIRGLWPVSDFERLADETMRLGNDLDVPRSEAL